MSETVGDIGLRMVVQGKPIAGERGWLFWRKPQLYVPISIENKTGGPLHWVQWWVSPWDAKGNPDDERYWSMPWSKGGFKHMHTGCFRLPWALRPGIYLAQIDFSQEQNGPTKHYPQCLKVVLPNA